MFLFQDVNSYRLIDQPLKETEPISLTDSGSFKKTLAGTIFVTFVKPV